MGLVACAGCGSESDPTTAEPATFTQIYDRLFPAGTPAKCLFCHSQPASNISNGNLHLGAAGDREAAYQALVGKASTSKYCAGSSLVVPGDSEASILYLKLLDTPPCGERMPLGGGPLAHEEIEMIRGWIEAGAKND